MPSAPSALYPHAHTVPSLFSAKLWLPPAAMAATPVSALTATGVLLSVSVPLPNCPQALNPQAQTVPSPFNAKLCPAPPAMVATPESPLAWAGVSLPYGYVVVRVPLPNCPNSLSPQDHTVPSLFSARLRFGAAAIATAPVRPLTAMGVLAIE